MMTSARPYRVVVTGGRHFQDVPFLWRTLDDILAPRFQLDLAEGASDGLSNSYRGADYWANQWALARAPVVTAKRYPAHWDSYGRAAGPIRNRHMLIDFGPDLVVAFQGGTGTNNCVLEAHNLDIEIMDLRNYAR